MTHARGAAQPGDSSRPGHFTSSLAAGQRTLGNVEARTRHLHSARERFNSPAAGDARSRALSKSLQHGRTIRPAGKTFGAAPNLAPSRAPARRGPTFSDGGETCGF